MRLTSRVLAACAVAVALWIWAMWTLSAIGASPSPELGSRAPTSRAQDDALPGRGGYVGAIASDTPPSSLPAIVLPSAAVASAEAQVVRTSGGRTARSPLSDLVTLGPRYVHKECNEKLYTPTFVAFVEALNSYVLVDCWHHRVMLAPTLDAPIPEWTDLLDATYIPATASRAEVAAAQRSMTSLNIPHSIATNGDLFVTESSVGGSNGDNHSVLVFRFVQPGSSGTPVAALEFLQEVHGCDGNRARRPHRIIYDAATDSFFLYMTSPAFLSRFQWDPRSQTLVRKSCQSLPFMKGMYARSILAVNGSLYITAGPGVITRTAMDASSGLMVKQQSYSTKYLGFVKGKMNDLAYFDGWWYATSTVPCAMVRFRSIDRLWDHEKIHNVLGLCKPFSRRATRCLGGTPYFVSKVGDRIFVPYIFGCSGVTSFRVNGASGDIEDVRQHWGSGWVEDGKDLECRGAAW